MEMALTGEPITAQEALDAGLLGEMTEPGKALDAAIALAERIAENAPLAVKASKSLVRSAAMGIEETSCGKSGYPCKNRYLLLTTPRPSGLCREARAKLDRHIAQPRHEKLKQNQSEAKGR